MPTVWCRTFATGARQFVVHEAFEITTSAPSSSHGRPAGSVSAYTGISVPSTRMKPSPASTDAGNGPYTESCFNGCASISTSATSLRPAHSISARRSNAARNAQRPTRPKPLIATRVDMLDLPGFADASILDRARRSGIAGGSDRGCGKAPHHGRLPSVVRRQEDVGLVAVQDGGDVQSDVRDRRPDRVERHEGRNAPDHVAGDGRAHLRRAKVAVAQVIRRSHRERGDERCETDQHSARDMRPERASGERGEDGEDRECREQQPVRGAVDDAAPENYADQSDPAWSLRRVLHADDHRREDKREDQAQPCREDESPPQHLAQWLTSCASPQDEEPSD